jgi:ribosomal protein S18 acetylase RimI-like enzyme
LQIRSVPYTDILVFRQQVLKPDFSLQECVNPGDLRVDTFHYAAFIDDKLVGCASFEYEKHPDLPGQQVYRLRGMAADPSFRRQGIGRSLVLAGEDKIRSLGGDLLWFNARVMAFAFYQSLGFQFFGEEFTIPRIGPHKLMYKVISAF